MSKNMILVHSEWNKQPSFRLIPVDINCPYNEAIYDTDEKVLAIIAKDKKESFHFLPKLNEHGDIVMVKTGKRPDGKPYAEQRVALSTYYEYFLNNDLDIKSFIQLFACNADSFPWANYIAEKEETTSKT